MENCQKALRVATGLAPAVVIMVSALWGVACSGSADTLDSGIGNDEGGGSGGTSGGGSGGSPGSGGHTGSSGAGTSSSSGGSSSSSSSGDTGSSGGGSSSSTGGGASGNSGGSSGAGTADASSGPPSICDGAGTRILASTAGFVDDFEECAISPGWSSFNDVMPMHDVFHIQQAPGGAAGTAHGGHYAGTGAVVTSAGGFGAGTVYNVAIDPAAKIYCIDVSAFDGVSFWAKPAAAGSKITLNFVVPQTNVQSVDPMGRPNGGDCVMNCFNHPRVTLTLTADWTLYAVKFSDAGGGSAPVGNRIQELAWLTPDSNWDFSIDEIAFYKGTPPAGAVGPGPNACGGDAGH